MRDAYEAYGNSFYGYGTVRFSEIERFKKQQEKEIKGEAIVDPPSPSTPNR